MSQNSVGVSALRLATWDAISEWERHIVRISVMGAVDALRQREV